MRQQCQTSVGGLCPSAVAVKQALTGFKLQRGDLLAERRLGHHQCRGSLAEAARLNYGYKVFKAMQVDGIPLGWCSIGHCIDHSNN
jgi:hypothetical protein